MRPTISETQPDATWLTTGRFAVILALLIGVAYHDVLFDGKSFFFRDFGFFGYPLANYHRESFWRGELPLWNPLSNCGLPFLAQWNTLTLYPGSLIYLLLPMPWSLSFYGLVHLWVAGLTMRKLAFAWTGHQLGSAVAGLAYALNGLSTTALMWPNNVAALAWVPLVILLVDRALQRGGRAMVMASLIGALQMLTGAPELILFTWTLAAVLSVGQANSPADLVRRGLRLGAVLGVVLLLAGLQLMPFLELLRHSQRQATFAGSEWSMPLLGWANFLIPLFQTYPAKLGVYIQGGQQWTSSYYTGAGVFLLAGLALWRVRERRVWLAGFLVLSGLGLALGDSGVVYHAMKSLLPQLGMMRYPIKFVCLALPLICLLGAVAIRWLAANNSQKNTLRHAFFAVGGFSVLAMTAIAIWSWAKPVPGEVFVTTLNSALSRLALVVGLLLALRLACQPVSSWRSFAAQAAVLGLVALDLLTFAPRQNPAVDRTGLEPRLKPMQELHPLPRHGMSRAMISPRADEKLRYEASADPLTDYLCHRLGLFSNLNLLENIPKVNGFYSLYLREAGEVTEALYRSELPVQPAYDFLGVSQLTRPGELFEWTNRPAFLPLVTAGQQPVFVSDQDSLPHFLDPDFDPRRSVLVSVGEQKKLSSRHWESATVAEAHCSAHEIHATVESSGPAMIVFSQAYYQCWQAKVDGQPAHLLRANHGFQAIEVTSSGRHNIILEYKDHGLAIGAVLSGLGLLICAIGWCGQPAIAREETVAS